MPDINQLGQCTDRDLDLKLKKGPGETYASELLFSENVTSGEDQFENNFDFALRAFISGSRNTPDKALLQGRGTIPSSLN